MSLGFLHLKIDRIVAFLVEILKLQSKETANI